MDSVEVGEIKDLKDLHEALTDLRMNQIGPNKIYFRGESTNGWPLIPKLLRRSTIQGEHGREGFTKKKDMSIEEIQTCLLERLKRHAVHLYLGSNRPWQGEHPSDWEWLCVAQHHGLPTLLLDWSLNPLVAFYFSAWKDHAVNDGAFYVMKLQDKELRDEEKLTIRIGQNIASADDRKRSLLDDDAHRPLIVVPLVFTRRIEAQASRFIYTGYAGNLIPTSSEFDFHPDNSSTDEPFANWALDKTSTEKSPWVAIKKYIVPRDAKRNILRQLANVQINHGTLFPDLDGHSTFLGAGGD